MFRKIKGALSCSENTYQGTGGGYDGRVCDVAAKFARLGWAVLTGSLADEVVLAASVDVFAVKGANAVAGDHAECVGFASVQCELAIVAAFVDGFVSSRYISP